MSKLLKIYDNSIPKFLQDSIHNEVFKEKKIPWSYSNNIAGPDKGSYPGIFHSFLRNPHNINSTEKPSIQECFFTDYCHFFNQVLYSFTSLNNIVIYQIVDGRLFMNFPLIKAAETKRYIHTDKKYRHLVGLYYINDTDGDTIFYEDDEKTEIRKITPKKGRMAIFDGSIPHTGGYPTLRERAILNFNFIGQIYE